MKINTILLLIGKIKGMKIEKPKPELSVTGESEPLVNFGNISAAADGAAKPGPRSRGRSRLQANSRMRQYFSRMNDSKKSQNSKTLWDKRDPSPLDDMNIDDPMRGNALGMFGEPWDGNMISYS